LLDQNNSNLKLREDPAEGYYVNGLKVVKVNLVSDFQKLLKRGEKARHYRSTDIHEHSSRSHSIFRIMIENRLSETRKIILDKELKNKEANPGIDSIFDDVRQRHISYGTKYSILNLVDLAGSERISESGNKAIEET